VELLSIVPLRLTFIGQSILGGQNLGFFGAKWPFLGQEKAKIGEFCLPVDNRVLFLSFSF
jgi:hypothetical protein